MNWGGLSMMRAFTSLMNGISSGSQLGNHKPPPILDRLTNMRLNLQFRPSLGEFREGKPYQKFIHFPKTSMLSTKDNLCRVMKKMKVRNHSI
jgi:hypothetical protein